MLHGIGGSTVEEAKRKLSYREFLMWRSFVKKNGLPAQGAEANERAFAMLTWEVHRGNGGKAKFEDFLPRPRSAHDDQTLRMARMMGIKV